MPPEAAAAGIGAVGSIAGGILGGDAQKKAAKIAAKAQVKVAKMNNALATEMYAKNASRLDPFAYNGLRSSNVLTELLLGPSGVQTNPGSQSAPAGATAQEQLDFLLHGSADVIGPERSRAIARMSGSPEQKLAYALSVLKPTERQYFNAYQLEQQSPFNNPGATQAGTGSALSAWDQFRNSTNYQFRLDEGTKALNQGYAAKGALDSGAAQIALQERAQQFASNELGNWMNLLAGQQGMGLTASSALAGVGQNLVNNVTANNNNAADAQSNQALLNGQATANMWSQIGSGVGQLAGALSSSFGGGGYKQAQSGYSSPYSFYQGIGNYGG